MSPILWVCPEMFHQWWCSQFRLNGKILQYFSISSILVNFLFRTVQLLPQRHVHAIMSFLALLSVSTSSGILALTITQMVKPIATIANATNAALMAKLKQDSCPMRDQPIYHNASLDEDMVHNVFLVYVRFRFYQIQRCRPMITHLSN